MFYFSVHAFFFFSTFPLFPVPSNTSFFFFFFFFFFFLVCSLYLKCFLLKIRSTPVITFTAFLFVLCILNAFCLKYVAPLWLHLQLKVSYQPKRTTRLPELSSFTYRDYFSFEATITEIVTNVYWPNGAFNSP